MPKRNYKKIYNRDGNYVIGLKANQESLYAEVKNYFYQALEVEPSEAYCDYAVSEERNRKREEKREVWTTQELSWLPEKDDWVGLKSLICIRSSRTIKGKRSVEMRLFLSSLEADALQAMHAVRAHWGIGNRVHWHFDVSYNEDASKVRKDNGPENLSVLQRCTLNLIKADTTIKIGVKNKRAKAGWDRNYLLSLLDNAK